MAFWHVVALPDYATFYTMAQKNEPVAAVRQTGFPLHLSRRKVIFKIILSP